MQAKGGVVLITEKVERRCKILPLLDLRVECAGALLADDHPEKDAVVGFLF